MGILNVTPDSFSDGGNFLNTDLAVKRAIDMVKEGASLIDVGGESSRPGSKRISVQEELDRVMPVIKKLKNNIDVPISVDTYKSPVASAAIREGASFINDITALLGDGNMAKIISDHGAGVILMHMKGAPETMQKAPFYENVVDDVFSFLKAAIARAEIAGISGDKIIIDPGIGFGKRLDHNLDILANLGIFKKLGKLLMVGTSRKSFIGDITGKEIGERIFGTAATVALALMKGADIVRVHDVKEMRDVAIVIDAILNK